MAHLQYPYVNYFSSFLFFFSFLENFIRDITFLPSDYGPHREKTDSLNQGEEKKPLRDRSETLRQKSPIKEEGKKKVHDVQNPEIQAPGKSNIYLRDETARRWTKHIPRPGLQLLFSSKNQSPFPPPVLDINKKPYYRGRGGEG